ncbi:hypothetical protein MVEN_00681700 [Mycena venus]|uniref:Ubiquitin-like domain-containing protein n=1 Tax=Mycena venus TaxID=2733690 RepID=A0A8H6YED7_9AGAR|nr:hypothetical protein MVEN_00681700 [Mycena venus]
MEPTQNVALRAGPPRGPPNHRNRPRERGEGQDSKDVLTLDRVDDTVLEQEPREPPDRAGHLQSLAVSFIHRYWRSGDLQDLEAALKNSQTAVSLTPEGHPDHARRLQSLAALLRDRYQRLGDLRDLEAALQSGQEAVALAPEGHPDRARHLQSLAALLRDRYQRLGNLRDLEAALQNSQEAFALTPEGYTGHESKDVGTPDIWGGTGGLGGSGEGDDTAVDPEPLGSAEMNEQPESPDIRAPDQVDDMVVKQEPLGPPDMNQSESTDVADVKTMGGRSRSQLLEDILLLQRTSPTEDLFRHINSRGQGLASKKPVTLEPPPHIDSAFLIESSSHPGLRLNDFNGRQAYVPLELCRSWTDLCFFLDIFLRGDSHSHFITRENFGIRVEDKEDLLSRDTWDPWVSSVNGDLSFGEPHVTCDLYAIIDDESNSCPRCKEPNPVKDPLPGPGGLQRCVKCPFTFRVLYQVGPPTSAVPRISGILQETLSRVAMDVSDHPGSTSVSSESERINTPHSDFTYPPRPPDQHVSRATVIESSGTSLRSVPDKVLLRRRKPFEQDSGDGQTSSIRENQASPPPPSPPFPKDSMFFRILYAVFSLNFPNRYRKAAEKSHLPGSTPCATCSQLKHKLCETCYKPYEICYKRWGKQWTLMGGIAGGVLFSTLIALFQITSATDDPMVHVPVQLAIVCQGFGIAYASILSFTVGDLESERTDGIAWMDKVAQSPRNTFWSPAIMLSMPVAWIIWGVFCFAFAIMTFLLRSGTTDEPDENSRLSPHQAYAPRAITMLLFVVGMVYLVRILMTVTRIGSGHIGAV